MAREKVMYFDFNKMRVSDYVYNKIRAKANGESRTGQSVITEILEKWAKRQNKKN